MKTYRQIVEGTRFEPKPGQKLEWAEYMRLGPRDRERIKTKLVKGLKLKRIKDVRSKAQRIGVTLDSFETPDGVYRLEMVGSHFKNFKSGKSRPIWKIWNNDQTVPQYGPHEYDNFKKAKIGLVDTMMRIGKIDIIA